VAGIIESDEQYGNLDADQFAHLFSVFNPHVWRQSNQGCPIVDCINRSEIVGLQVKVIGMQQGDVSGMPPVVVINAEDFRFETVLLEEASYRKFADLDTDHLQALLFQPEKIQALTAERNENTLASHEFKSAVPLRQVGIGDIQVKPNAPITPTLMPKCRVQWISPVIQIACHPSTRDVDSKVTPAEQGALPRSMESGYTAVQQNMSTEEQMDNPYKTPASDPQLPPAGEIDTSSPLSPKGRFGRLSFIAWYMLVTILSYIAMGLLGGTTLFMETDPDRIALFFSGSGGVLYALLTIFTTVLLVIFVIRRLHDVNTTGWLAMLLIVPLVNLFLLLYLLLKRGDEGSNRFAAARPTPGWEKVLGYTGTGLIVLGFIGVMMAIMFPALMQ
jgi:uncharacterized membrane protein YhaH (DUF805 family)